MHSGFFCDCAPVQVLMKPGDMVLVSAPFPKFRPCMSPISGACMSVVSGAHLPSPRQLAASLKNTTSTDVTFICLTVSSPCSMRAHPVPTAGPTPWSGASWQMCFCSASPTLHDIHSVHRLLQSRQVCSNVTAVLHASCSAPRPLLHSESITLCAPRSMRPRVKQPNYTGPLTVPGSDDP